MLFQKKDKSARALEKIQKVWYDNKRRFTARFLNGEKEVDAWQAVLLAANAT